MAFNNTTNLTDLVETAFDRKVEWKFRSTPQFRDIVSKRPEQQAMPGDVVTFTIQNDLDYTVAKTPLSETTDVTDRARPAPTRVSVTLVEYGDATVDTIRLRRLAFTDIPEEQVTVIGRAMVDTVDELVRDVLDASTNIYYVDSTNAVAATTPGVYGNASAKLYASGVARLRALNVPSLRGRDTYPVYVHPDIALDLRLETGDQGWLKPHQYVDVSNIYRGETGTFVGAAFIETPRCKKTGTVYTSYMCGFQGLAEAVAIEPHTVIGPVVDKLKRFYPLGWHTLIGWSLFRPEATRLLKQTSSIASLA